MCTAAGKNNNDKQSRLNVKYCTDTGFCICLPVFLIDIFIVIAGKHNFPLVEMQFCVGSLVTTGKQD